MKPKAPAPLAIDLFCGLGGWTDGLLLEGWNVIGFDIERHDYGTGGYPSQLVIQDVLTLHGSQFKDASLIVASPPCQNYSYLAMPWSRSTNPNNSLKAKALRKKWETEGPDNRLFDACFRIQREAIATAGRYIPLIVENVRGCQAWTSRAAWNYGSFYFWGDVPALMPSNRILKNVTGGSWFGIAAHSKTATRQDPRDVRKDEFGRFVGIMNKARDFLSTATAIKGECRGWFNDNKRSGKDAATGYPSRSSGRSLARKAASAQIAKIPLSLSRHIAQVYFPHD